jgi:inhibitor of cysteine peptidase
MAEYRIERADTEKVVEVNLGDSIIISLPENVTTGYRWSVDLLDEHIVDLQDSQSTLQHGSGIGRGSSRTFFFRAKAVGVTPAQFLLRRSWGPKESAVDEFTMTVQVRSGEEPL